MVDLALHLLIFSVTAVAAFLVPLTIGRLVRPHEPTPAKEAIYECGEPTIGSSYLQFDLRFYVVALLFIVFDVEVAFFFPWAAVFGTAVRLADPSLAPSAAVIDPLAPDAADRLSLSARLLPSGPGTANPEGIAPATAELLAWTGLFDLLVFFGVLLVGFAYVWRRGDLDWVRVVAEDVRRTQLANRDRRGIGRRPPTREPVPESEPTVPA